MSVVSSVSSFPGLEGAHSTHSSDVEDLGPCRVETTSLDEVQDKQLKHKKDKLFKAVQAGDIQLVRMENWTRRSLSLVSQSGAA